MPGTIKEYVVPVDQDEFEMELPSGGALLSFQMWRGRPRLWVLAGSEALLEKVSFKIYRSGQYIETNPTEMFHYVGSVYKHAHYGRDEEVLHLFVTAKVSRIVPPGMAPGPGPGPGPGMTPPGFMRPGRN